MTFGVMLLYSKGNLIQSRNFDGKRHRTHIFDTWNKLYKLEGKAGWWIDIKALPKKERAKPKYFNRETKEVYESLSEAGRALNINPKRLWECLNKHKENKTPIRKYFKTQ